MRRARYLGPGAGGDEGWGGTPMGERAPAPWKRVPPEEYRFHGRIVDANGALVALITEPDYFRLTEVADLIAAAPETARQLSTERDRVHDLRNQLELAKHAADAWQKRADELDRRGGMLLEALMGALDTLEWIEESEGPDLSKEKAPIKAAIAESEPDV